MILFYKKAEGENRMKRRISIVLICIVLLLSISSLTAKADNSGLIFVSTNDKLYGLGTMASYAGVAYIPSSVFADFGIYTNYFEASNTVMLYHNDKQIFFDMANGNAFDSNQNTYDVSAVFVGNYSYVPAAWTASYFGLSFSYISGIGYGDIARVTDGTQSFTDHELLSNSLLQMKDYYIQYYGITNEVPPQPTDTPDKPEPSPDDKKDDEDDDEDEDNSDVTVNITFKGIPNKKILDTLESYNVKAVFFVTEEEVIDNPDITRRICGSGHKLGVYCTENVNEKTSQTLDAIFEAAQIRPLMMASDSEISYTCIDYANNNAFEYYEPTIRMGYNVTQKAQITSQIEPLCGKIGVMLSVNDNTSRYLSSLLYWLTDKKYNIRLYSVTT